MAKRRRVTLAPPGSPVPAGRRDEKVMVAYPYGTFAGAFVTSLVMLLVHDAHHGRHVIDGGYFLALQTTNLPHGRNQIVRTFLENTTADWLWFIDTDQTFDPDVLDRMLASADPKERPILGALVFSFSVGDAQEIVPTLWTIRDEQIARIMQIPDRELLTLAATGTGCVLIHRTVLEAVRDMPVPGRDHTYGDTSWPWFQYSDWRNNEGLPDVMGEDLTFFLRAAAAGFLPTVDTSIEVGHVKQRVISRADYEAQPLPAEAIPTFVVVPVKGQHDLTDQLVADLLDQDEHDGIFILDNGADTDPYPNPYEVTVIPAAGMNIGQMWNRGCELVAEGARRSNIAILNNDLKIGPRFLSGLATVLRSHPRMLAVCPNYDGRDGSGFQQVHGIAAGRHDGTGGLAGFAFMIPCEAWMAGARFDEQYDLWFTDTDYCLQLDQLGGVYGIALDTTVEHIGGGSQTLHRTPEWRARAAADSDKFQAKWST